jgi:hypothetical protein
MRLPHGNAERDRHVLRGRQESNVDRGFTALFAKALDCYAPLRVLCR